MNKRNSERIESESTNKDAKTLSKTQMSIPENSKTFIGANFKKLFYTSLLANLPLMVIAFLASVIALSVDGNEAAFFFGVFLLVVVILYLTIRLDSLGRMHTYYLYHGIPNTRRECYRKLKGIGFRQVINIFLAAAAAFIIWLIPNLINMLRLNPEMSGGPSLFVDAVYYLAVIGCIIWGLYVLLVHIASSNNLILRAKTGGSVKGARKSLEKNHLRYLMIVVLRAASLSFLILPLIFIYIESPDGPYPEAAILSILCWIVSSLILSYCYTLNAKVTQISTSAEASVQGEEVKETKTASVPLMTPRGKNYISKRIAAYFMDMMIINSLAYTILIIIVASGTQISEYESIR